MDADGARVSRIESIASQHDATIDSTTDEPTITVGVDRLHAFLLALRDDPAAVFFLDLCHLFNDRISLTEEIKNFVVDFINFGSQWDQGFRY